MSDSIAPVLASGAVPHAGACTGPPVLPRFSRIKAGNGLSLVLVERPELPLVHLTFMARAGGLFDPPGKAGLAALVTSLLSEGTRQRTSAEIINGLEDMGANLVPRVDWRAASLSLGVLTSDAEQAADMLLELISRPRFPREALDTARQRTLVRLRQQLFRLDELADRLLDRALYGDGPYGRSLFGDENSLGSMTTEDLRRFHASRFTALNSMLLAVGRFGSDALAERLISAATVLGSGHPAPEPPSSRPCDASPSRVIVVDVPSASQTVIRLGQLSVRQSGPDSDRLRLVTTILAGNSAGRLNARLRETFGYTYQVHSLLQPRAAACLFLVGASVCTDRVGECVRIVREELERLQAETVSRAELAIAQNRLIGVQLRSFQTNHDLASQMVRLALYDFQENYFEHYLARLHDVEPDTLRELARRYIQPQALTVVAVGPATTLTHQLADLGDLAIFDRWTCLERVGERRPSTNPDHDERR